MILCVQGDTLLLVSVFKNFQKMFLEICKLNSALFCMRSSLKKSKVKVVPLTDITMLLMIKKDIRRGMCHAIYRYVKIKNKYMKYYCKNK